HRLLSQVEIAEQADQGGEDAAGLGAGDLLPGATDLYAWAGLHDSGTPGHPGGLAPTTITARGVGPIVPYQTRPPRRVQVEPRGEKPCVGHPGTGVGLRVRGPESFP